jgi:HAD superfamily hydrolase (TIGR01662 family)
MDKKEIILICGLPAAGKSTIVNNYIQNGYTRLSRDIEGGGLDDLNESLEKQIKAGKTKIIMDNTYVTRESRKPVINIGHKNGYEVTCVHLATLVEDALYNSVSRMIKKHGKMFTQDSEYKAAKDPNTFPSAAIYRANKMMEKPDREEGFDHIQTLAFNRVHNGYTNKAVIFDYDGTLRKTKSGAEFPVDPSDIEILPGRIEKLQDLKSQGYILLGVSNQSGVAKGQLTYETAEACFDKTNELLGFDIDYRFCPHRVPPITCYCRKPGPGHGVELIEQYKLDPEQCIMVGDMKTDETFAKRCGFKYVHADKFFA